MADDEKTEGEGEMEGLHDLGMGTLTLALTLGILARAWLSKYIKLPYTVSTRWWVKGQVRLRKGKA
jgi:hypothetical protein